MIEKELSQKEDYQDPQMLIASNNEQKFQISQDINNMKTQSQDQNQYTVIDRRDSKHKMIQSKVTKTPLSTGIQDNKGDDRSNSDEGNQLQNGPTIGGGGVFLNQMTVIANKRWQYVASFIQKIKQQSSTFRFTLSRKPQLDLINDLSFSYNYFYYKDKFLYDVMLQQYLFQYIEQYFIKLETKLF